MKNELQTVNTGVPNNVIIEDRKRMSISGVLDVESFDENEISLNTTGGNILVTGEDMRVERLSIETGDIVIEGFIICIEYSDKHRGKEGFWSRLF